MPWKAGYLQLLLAREYTPPPLPHQATIFQNTPVTPRRRSGGPQPTWVAGRRVLPRYIAESTLLALRKTPYSGWNGMALASSSRLRANASAFMSKCGEFVDDVSAIRRRWRRRRREFATKIRLYRRRGRRPLADS